jgi:hypothetical protein
MGWRLAMASMFLFACGRIDYDPLVAPAPDAHVDARLDAPALDAPAHDASEPDARLDAPSDAIGVDATDGAADSGVGCVWTGVPPFVDVAPVPSVNTDAREEDPQLLADGLTLYFVSERLGTADVYVATRARPEAPFGAPTFVNGLADPVHEEYFIAFVDASELSGVLSSIRAGGLGGADLYMASRPNTTAAFDTFVPLPGFNTTGHEFDPALHPPTGDLYFASERAGGAGLLDIYRAPRLGDADWAAPTPTSGLNTTEQESGLTFTPDGRHVLYTYLNDIYYAVHEGGGVFTDVTLVAQLATPDVEAEPRISPDGCEVFFTRNSTATDWDVFHARVEP